MRFDEVVYPVYALRKHYNIFEEGGLKYIDTYRGRWILDSTIDSAELLVDRRMNILAKGVTDRRPLYPLKYRCDDWKEILGTNILKNYNMFIDAKGRIFKLRGGIQAGTRKGIVLKVVTFPVIEIIKNVDYYFHVIQTDTDIVYGVFKEPCPYFACAKVATGIYTPLFGSTEEVITRKRFVL
jgi:hypothetical protein